MSVEEELREKRGVVALMDALGTKGVLASRKPQEVLQGWREFLITIDGKAQLIGDGLNLQIAAFSDTVLITMEGEDYAVLLERLADFLAPVYYVAMRTGIFLRGAISCGRYYQWDSKVVGPAIDEAAAWYEEGEWIGTLATPSVEHYFGLLEARGEIVPELFVPYEIPLKSRPGRDVAHQGWAYLWPMPMIREMGVGLKAEILDSFVEHAGVINGDVLPKYRNTIRFLEFALESHLDALKQAIL